DMHHLFAGRRRSNVEPVDVRPGPRPPDAGNEAKAIAIWKEEHLFQDERRLVELLEAAHRAGRSLDRLDERIVRPRIDLATELAHHELDHERDAVPLDERLACQL